MSLHFGSGSFLKPAAPLAHEASVLNGEFVLGCGAIVSGVPELVCRCTVSFEESEGYEHGMVGPALT